MTSATTQAMLSGPPASPAPASSKPAASQYIGQRLKQSGMHWTTDGADAIIALRCREASSQWEAICNTPHTQTRTA
jgi:hypothetical protein